MLVGRRPECARIDVLIEGARGGTSGSLVFRGDPGIGKSALLEYAAEHADGLRVLRAHGVESESQLPYAALHELARPILGRLDTLPEPQQLALRGAFALASNGVVDRFAVYAATLGLVAAEAEAQPLLCLVDDAHWLDPGSAEALTFACRRLEAEGVVMLFAAREGEPRVFDATGLPEQPLGGLERSDAAELLEQQSNGGFASSAAERVLDLAGGNPLALIEIPSVLSHLQVSGDDVIDEPLLVGERVQRAFLERASNLSENAGWALLLAAASETARVETVTAALGGAVDALEEAEAAGLVALDADRIEFRHPLVRSSIYHSAPAARRRAAHAALAEAVSDRGSRAWHLAAATVGPDEDLARLLEEVGLEARERGAPAAAASALERAARLTPDEPTRARRLLAAGDAAWLAGRSGWAGALLDEGVAAATDPVLHADIQSLRARVMMWAGSVHDAHELMVAESERVQGVDPARAAVLMAMAAGPCFISARVARGLETTTRAVGLAQPVGGLPALIAGVLHAEALLLSGRELEGRPVFEGVRPLLDGSELPANEETVAWLAQPFMWIEDFDAARLVVDRTIDEARRRGSLRGLPFALVNRAEIDLRTGRFAEAYAGASEGVRLARETGQETGIGYGLVMLAWVEAAQGREADCRDHVDQVIAIAKLQGTSSLETYAGAAIGLLELGLGRIPEAVAALEPWSELDEERGVTLTGVVQWAPDLVEAYVRARRNEDAERLVETFYRHALEVGRAWPLATAARCRGLLADAGEFASVFDEALAHHAVHPSLFERARTELVYGERLRRARLRVEAREHLKAAVQAFDHLGAAPWAERARAELGASGASLRPRDPAARDKLTPQELQVALIVAEGKTNREAAAALFLSTKTVEFHLHNAFRKLGVRSRTELARLVASDDPVLQPA